MVPQISSSQYNFVTPRSTSDFHYSWTREGAMLPKHSELSDHNRVLVIREARLEDQGVYTCHVQRESIAEHKAVDLKLKGKNRGGVSSMVMGQVK
ncbi:contactin [Plakobranchus ocellatus]|uniref:Contactin n=1 Tax=Plakobranchus ocellatus TaxID=259542 RepID=A0AAV4AYE7_9GAST|nr:contactin [Plakobranchus ocellatus]